VLRLGAEYGERPSRLIGIEDGYTAFCFDEACGFISGKLRERDAKEPARRERAGAGNAGAGDLVEYLRGFGK